MVKKPIELDPANREWEYDGDGNKIYKPEAGFGAKTPWEEFEENGMYHKQMGEIPKKT